MNIAFPLGTSVPKAEIEIVPPEHLVRSALASADVKLLFTKSNRILVHDIYVQPFTEDVAAELQQKIEGVIGVARNRYKEDLRFSVITSRLSCVPSAGCRFTWVRVGFDLGGGPQPTVVPIACMLFPENQQDSVKVTSSVEISGQLKVKVLETGVKQKDEKSVDQQQYHITTLGAFSSNPAWDFKKTAVHPEIKGDLTLLMVVASMKSAESTGSIRLSATAELDSGMEIPLVTRRTTEDAAAITFTI